MAAHQSRLGRCLVRNGEQSLMPGRAAKQKGNRGERELVELLRAHGIEAKRVPLSGAVEGFKGDVLVSNGDGTEQTWEVKRRGQGFQRIEGWLEGADVLAFRRDRGEWFICQRLADWVSSRNEARRECSLRRNLTE